MRLGTAIVQGLALYFLFKSGGPKTWSLAEQQIYVPLRLIAMWVPWIVYLGVGQMRARPLVIWVVVASVVLAGIGYHEAARGRFGGSMGLFGLWGPDTSLWIAISLAAFISQVLVIDTTAEGRFVSSYERHFDTAWKIGVQTSVAILFAGIFWMVLILGAKLFQLIKLDFLLDLIKEPLFAYPASSLATATALHFTDMQPSVIRGIRQIILTLFAWLLPLLASIVLAFLVVLLFVPLDRLWGTRFAASLLLSSALILVFLINAAFQDARQSRWKFAFIGLASIELMPLVILAAWAVGLRVGQYGWTTDRIFAAAVAGVMFCYAAGYALALARRSAWQRSFETANVVTAYAVLATILALFSPLADPGRLMVADQLARLKSGKVDAAAFDYSTLLRDGARWGRTALEELSQTKDIADAENVNERALRALKGPAAVGRHARDLTGFKLTPEMVEVSPAGRTLPDSFFSADAGAFSKAAPACARDNANRRCRAIFVASSDGQREAVLFFDGWSARIVEPNAEGRWEVTGSAQGRAFCKSAQAAIAAGEVALEPHPWPDVIVGGERLTIVPTRKDKCQ